MEHVNNQKDLLYKKEPLSQSVRLALHKFPTLSFRSMSSAPAVYQLINTEGARTFQFTTLLSTSGKDSLTTAYLKTSSDRTVLQPFLSVGIDRLFRSRLSSDPKYFVENEYTG